MSGTSKTKQLEPVHLDLPLFWRYHYATCSPVREILYQIWNHTDHARNCMWNYLNFPLLAFGLVAILQIQIRVTVVSI